LGKSSGIALQGVSPAAPKPFSYLIVERDDGRFAIGWGDDAPGPFESRQFAAAVAAKVVAA
jgi:hypothetical protein